MIDYIRTYSGVKFHTVETSPADVKIEDIAQVLSRAPRWGGHSKRPYSVAAHCLFVAKLVPRELKLNALLHDASEAYIGDMPSPFKALLPDYKKVERRIMGAVATTFGLKYLDDPRIKEADLFALYLERINLFDLVVGNDVPTAKPVDAVQMGVAINWNWDYWTLASPHLVYSAFMKKFETYKSYE